MPQYTSSTKRKKRKYHLLSQVWWCTLVIPALKTLREEDQELEAGNSKMAARERKQRACLV
jgi:hypothetical protein